MTEFASPAFHSPKNHEFNEGIEPPLVEEPPSLVDAVITTAASTHVFAVPDPVKKIDSFTGSAPDLERNFSVISFIFFII